MTLDEKRKYLDIEKNKKEGVDISALTVGSHKRVWFVCDAGHSWEGMFKDVKHCPFCDGKGILSGYDDLATLYPDIAKEWHPTKNGELVAEKVSCNSSKKVYWLCSVCGYEYDAFVFNKTRRGDGCPACSMKRLVPGINDFATAYPELIHEWSAKNEMRPEELRRTDTTRLIIWDRNGKEYCESISRHLARVEREREGKISLNRQKIIEFISENEGFFSENWSEALNGFPYSELTHIKGKYRWRCSRCKRAVDESIETAMKRGIICEDCKILQRKRKIAEREAKKERNKARARSFGQSAIAFYLGRIDGVRICEEVLLEPARRFRVDIVVEDTVKEKRYAIEHDSERYHSSELSRAADAEKDGLMREKFDEVIHIVQGKKDSPARVNERYFYSESRLSELEAVIKRFINDNFECAVDVDIKRDTMQILRMKNYSKNGRAEWNKHILDRLSEDWHSEDNAGYELSDFSPRVYYNALWRCKNCGNAFYAAICNRARGDVCTKCKNRRKKVAPYESFASVYPQKAKNWAAENELSAAEVTPSSGYNALWHCDVCGHTWQTPVNIVARSKYGGCRVCGREYVRQMMYKKVEKLDPISGELLCTYNGIVFAKSDGFPKVERAIKSGKIYKGFIWRLKS